MRRPETGVETWHVFLRGSRRMALFRDDQDCAKFLSILKFATDLTGCLLFAWILMGNHYHLVMKATSRELSDCMRRVNYLYSVYHNEKYGITGHAFEGPYHALRLKGAFFILRTIAYVILNPVAGRLVKRPEDYRWSCIRSYLGVPGCPLPVETEEILSLFSSRIDLAREEFRRFLDQRAAVPKRSSPNVPTSAVVHEQQFGWLLEHSRMQGKVEGISPELRAVWWGREVGIWLKTMARSLGEHDSRRLTYALKRLEIKLERTPQLRKLLTPP